MPNIIILYDSKIPLLVSDPRPLEERYPNRRKSIKFDDELKKLRI